MDPKECIDWIQRSFWSQRGRARLFTHSISLALFYLYITNWSSIIKRTSNNHLPTHSSLPPYLFKSLSLPISLFTFPSITGAAAWREQAIILFLLVVCFKITNIILFFDKRSNSFSSFGSPPNNTICNKKKKKYYHWNYCK